MRAKQLIESLVEVAKPAERSGWTRIITAAYGLYTLAYSYHWKAKGENYYSDHLLFQRLYEATEEDIDPIAEKAIGTTDDDTFLNALLLLEGAAMWVTRWDPSGTSVCSEFVNNLLMAETDFIDEVGTVKQEFENKEMLTNGIDDFLQALANKHEEHVYLLRQRRRK